MIALITGITGFVGSHLADYILANHNGIDIIGTKRWRSKMDNVDHLGSSVKYYECDLTDSHNTNMMIAQTTPDVIFHLAAQSFVPTSWDSPTATLSTNIGSQCNLFEAVHKVGDNYNPVILIAGSSEEYGLVYENEVPIKETNPLRPLSPYAVSKVGQDYLAYQYHKSYGMRIIRTRAFNHTGPRRGEVFVSSNFAKQVAEIEMGLREPIIEVGNLEAIRDFTDVRDIVRGYWLATEKCEPGEVYNLASGKGITIQKVLDMLLELSTRNDITVRQDPKRMRPSDVMSLIGDNSKFSKITGWKPVIAFEQTLADILQYWREECKQ